MSTPGDPPVRRPGSDATRRRTRHLLAQSVGLLGVYFLVPVAEPLTGRAWARGIAAGLLLAAVLWFVVTTVVRQMRAGDADVRLDRLVLAAVSGIVAFALADYAIARADPGQFSDLRTRTDALYFALSTLTTVGYGDVHPDGQLARQVVTAQLVFNVVVLAGAARTLARGMAGRSQRTRPATPPGSGSGVEGLHLGQPPDHRDVERDEQQ